MQRLNPANFRVHRSAIVNINRIAEVRRQESKTMLYLKVFRYQSVRDGGVKCAGCGNVSNIDRSLLVRYQLLTPSCRTISKPTEWVELTMQREVDQ